MSFEYQEYLFSDIPIKQLVPLGQCYYRLHLYVDYFLTRLQSFPVCILIKSLPCRIQFIPIIKVGAENQYRTGIYSLRENYSAFELYRRGADTENRIRVSSVPGKCIATILYQHLEPAIGFEPTIFRLQGDCIANHALRA